MNKLDFVVIGAAKSATTSLFELSKDHPEICMPKEKEAPFYSDEKLYKRGQDWYFKKYLSNCSSKKSKTGTITPQYMLGEHVEVEEIARRIKDNNPDAKIVAILRHPIERAQSHYKMLFQRGYYKKDFSDSTMNLIKRKNNSINQLTSYLYGSEYGRILEPYFKFFGSDKILVLFTYEFKNNPKKTLVRFFDFISVDNSYSPPNPEAQHRKGGSKPKVSFLTPGFLFKIPFVKFVWKNFVPPPIRNKVEYNINLWNTAKDSEYTIDDMLYKKLVEFYGDDIEKLEGLIGKEVPWEEWH